MLVLIKHSAAAVNVHLKLAHIILNEDAATVHCSGERFAACFDGLSDIVGFELSPKLQVMIVDRLSDT